MLLMLQSTKWVQLSMPLLASDNKSHSSWPCIICGQAGHSFADCTLLQNTLQVATACGELKSIMDRACCSAASIHQAINPNAIPAKTPTVAPSCAPSVAPIQSLQPSVASSDISAITGPTLSLLTFGVSTIPPANDHPSDPAGADNPSVDTASTTDQPNFGGQPGFGPLHAHFERAHTRVCLCWHSQPNHPFPLFMPTPLPILLF